MNTIDSLKHQYPRRPDDMNPPKSPAQYVFRRPVFPTSGDTNMSNEELTVAITALVAVALVLVILVVVNILVGRRRRARLGDAWEKDAWVLAKEGVEMEMGMFSDKEEV